MAFTGLSTDANMNKERRKESFNRIGKKLSEEKTARMLIDMLIGEDRGEDPLRMARWTLSEFVITLLEAWTPEDKKRVVIQGAGRGMTLVDHAVIGDYDLALWHADREGDIYKPYMVSINNSGHSPLDPDAQLKKFKGKQAPLVELKAKINQWIDAYDSLIIGSIVPKRNVLYLKLFKHMFPERKINSYYTGDYTYGFRISK